MKKKNKMNSFLKVLLWMFVGACVGFVLGITGAVLQHGMGTVLLGIRNWISASVESILVVFIVIVALTSVICYRKGELYLKKIGDVFDDDTLDLYDKKFDFWLNLGMMVATIIIYLTIAVFAFHGRDMVNDEIGEILILLVDFFICIIIASFYQILAIRQIRKKEPMKRGDAADINFQKEWINSCDEGEKRIIFEAGYRTFQATKLLLLLATVIAIMIEMNFGGGLITIVFLTILNITLTIVYWNYARKLEKKGVAI